eukprot:gb/GEZN01010054.1/.p1 GENE.gb/GEZN01010054.1/~~gb/GEZN01010054.1/.p1  ORF type:complete len:302 (+),score=67.24 gb/GEZN01010054.1/:213-1118(+)
MSGEAAAPTGFASPAESQKSKGHRRELSVGASKEPCPEVDVMKEQIVKFLFEAADQAAVATVYRAAKAEKKRITAASQKEKRKAKADAPTTKLLTSSRLFGLRSKKDEKLLTHGWLLAKQVEVTEQINPLHGQHDAVVVEAADGSKIDPRAKTIQTISTHWRKAFFILSAEGLAKYNTEVKDTEDNTEEPVAIYHLGRNSSVKIISTVEFEVLCEETLGLRVLASVDQANWTKMLEKLIKLNKKRKTESSSHVSNSKSNGTAMTNTASEEDKQNKRTDLLMPEEDEDLTLEADEATPRVTE